HGPPRRASRGTRPRGRTRLSPCGGSTSRSTPRVSRERTLAPSPAMPPTRRDFLHASAAPLVGAAFTSDAMVRLARALAVAAGRSAESLADDEDFWFAVQQGFSIDRSLLNFNNGGTCPSPTVVMEAQKRHLDFSNHAPTKQMWGVLGPQLE